MLEQRLKVAKSKPSLLSEEPVAEMNKRKQTQVTHNELPPQLPLPRRLSPRSRSRRRPLRRRHPTLSERNWEPSERTSQLHQQAEAQRRHVEGAVRVLQG